MNNIAQEHLGWRIFACALEFLYAAVLLLISGLLSRWGTGDGVPIALLILNILSVIAMIAGLACAYFGFRRIGAFYREFGIVPVGFALIGVGFGFVAIVSLAKLVMQLFS